MEKMCPGEVSKHKTLTDTHLSARESFPWRKRCVKWGYGLVVAGKRKSRGFSSNKAFSLQVHSFACVTVVNVERREGPKS